MPSPDAALATMIKNLKVNTGKSIEQWVKVAAAAKLSKHGELVTHLKSEHGLGHGYANLVAQKTLKPELDSASGDDLVGAQYAGPKAALRSIYDAIIATIEKFGPDVEVSPKQTYVSLRRSKQFALVQPSTATRVDVGINLKGIPTTARLEASGSFNAMVTHRVRLESKSDVDAQLKGWLKDAYDKA